jgi:uncharacterized protein involved in outer membrane biogenesis
VKKALVSIAAVVVVAIVAALMAPSFIDWTGHKATIEREISAVTGRTLAIDGRVEAALLPSPRFVATSVRLAGPDAATDLARIGRVELSLAWAPLLAFRVQIASIRFVDPVLSLAALTQPPAGGAGDGASSVPVWRAVRLDNVVIENGRLLLPAPAGAPPGSIEQINGRLSADSLTGPVRATGAAVAQGVPLSFDAVLGDFASTRSVAANLNVELRPGLGKLQYRGALSRDGTRWTAQGRLQVESANFAVALAAAGVAVPADAPLAGALAQSMSLTATVSGDSDTLAVNDTFIQLGDARAEGATSLVLGARPVVDAAFVISRLDVDRLRRLQAQTAAPRQAAAPDALRLPTAPQATPSWLRGVEFNLDIGIDALVLGEGVLRQVRLNAATRRDGLVINQASAQLPGGSEVVLIGQIDGARDDPAGARIDGAVEVNSDNLRGLLQWAGIDVSGVPRDRLRRFAGTARLEGTLGQPTFSAIDMRLDSSRLTGGITLAVGRRVAFGADLRLDQLNLDAYRPVDAGTSGAPAATGPLDWIDNFDTNLRLRIDGLTWGTATAEGLVTDLTLNHGAIELRELAVRALAGATLRANGTLSNLSTIPQASLDLDLQAREADGFLRLVGLSLPPGLGALALSGHLDARPGDDIALRGLDLRLGDTRLTGQIRVTALVPRLKWSAELSGETVALDLLLGGLGGGTTRARAPQPTLAAPALRNPAAAAGRTAGGWSRQSLGLAALADMDADLTLAARTLSHDKLKLTDARLALKARENIVELTSLTGAIHGGTLDSSAKLMLAQSPALTLSGALTGIELRPLLELIAGTDALRGPADLHFEFSAAGDSPADLIGTLDGALEIASKGGTIDGYDLPALSEKLKRIDRPTDLITLVQLGLGGGRTPFTNLSGNLRLERGIARTNDLVLTAQAGEMRTTGTIDLPQWTLDLVNELRLTEHPKLPPLALKISGPINAPRRVFDIEKLQSHLLRRGTEPAR